MSHILARLQISPGRRWAGVAVLGLIGAGLIYVALAYPSTTWIGRVIVLLLGALMLLQAWWNLKVRSGALILKEDGLWVEDGPRLAGLDAIDTVQVSAFSIKPSNGFAVVLKNPVPLKWVPGLYWCVGHRIGVGGATSPSQSKAMAELLAALLIEER